MKDFLMCQQQFSKSQILLLTRSLRCKKIVVEKLDILVSLSTGCKKPLIYQAIVVVFNGG